jgi:putative methionine-R-sulfoxide reductase with GAF domain
MAMSLFSRSAIPELENFDQDELNSNPILNTPKPVPLIGALLIDEGWITREQLNACLLLQEQDHPDMPIGQILIHCGYIEPEMLDRVLEVQQDLKSSLVDRIETRALPAADLTTVILHERGAGLGSSVLNHLGVAATLVRDWDELGAVLEVGHYDAVLVSSDMLGDIGTLPDHGELPLLMLPPLPLVNGAFHLPQPIRSIIARFIVQVRAERRQRNTRERLYQCEFELNAIAAMSRSMTQARSGHEARVQLMRTIRDLFEVEAGTLYSYDHEAGQLVFEVVLGPHQETLYQQRLPIDRGLAGWVVRNGEPLLIPDVRRDARFEGMFDHQSGFQTRSALCVPLVANGEVCGVIQLLNKLNGAFNERDLLLLRILAALGSLVKAPGERMFELKLGR